MTRHYKTFTPPTEIGCFFRVKNRPSYLRKGGIIRHFFQTLEKNGRKRQGSSFDGHYIILYYIILYYIILYYIIYIILYYIILY